MKRGSYVLMAWGMFIALIAVAGMRGTGASFLSAPVKELPAITLAAGSTADQNQTFSAAAATVSYGDTNLITSENWVAVEVQNTSATALDNFVIQLRDAGGQWYDYLSGTDYATATDNLPWCSTTVPNTLAGSAYSHLRFCVTGHSHFRFGASGNGGVATVRVRWRSR